MNPTSLRRLLLLCVAVLALVACDDAETDAPDDDTSTPDATGDTTAPDASGDTATTAGDTSTLDASDDTADPTDADVDAEDGDVSGADVGEDAPDSTDTTTADTDTADDTDMGGPMGEAMFVAQGHVGRTTLSCDGGQSWSHDRAFDTEGDASVCGQVEPVVCYDEAFGGCQYMSDGTCQPAGTQCDCDHHPGAGQGVAAGDGVFVATWGWGPKGSVRRSTDGVTWDVVLEGTTFGGLAYGNGTFVLGDRQPRVSTDGGLTWTDGGMADLRAPDDSTVWNVRRLRFADVMGGRFVITGESGGARDVLVSADNGASWVRPTTLPASCASSIRGITGGNGVIVLTHGNGLVCHSSDGGVTFAEANIEADLTTSVVFDGTRFVTWARGETWTSPDGATWTSSPTAPDNLHVGPVAYDPATGTYVAVRGGWQVWYDAQRFYRSADGVTWTELDGADFTGSHAIRHMASGRVSSCPAP